MSNIRVLCVENHSEYMDALKYMLERTGYDVTPATTANRRKDASNRRDESSHPERSDTYLPFGRRN